MPAASATKSPNSRALLVVALAAAVILALGWAGIRIVRSHRTPASATDGSPSQAPGTSAPAAAEVREPAATAAPPKSSRGDRATSASALLEVIPEVPPDARRTIHGHIRVWVRVIVDPDGSVFAATADRTGPSRYFERLAIEAAKKWTFPAVDAPSRRLMQIRFDFSRDGTTGRAVKLD